MCAEEKPSAEAEIVRAIKPYGPGRFYLNASCLETPGYRARNPGITPSIIILPLSFLRCRREQQLIRRALYKTALHHCVGQLFGHKPIPARGTMRILGAEIFVPPALRNQALKHRDLIHERYRML